MYNLTVYIERKYSRGGKISENPMSVLNRTNKGTLVHLNKVRKYGMIHFYYYNKRAYEIFLFLSRCVNSNNFYLQLIREFALMALLFLPTLSDNDCRWCHAIEFWSSVICSMENSKTVHFHSVLDDNSNSILLESCFETFVHSIARKCAIATMLRTYMFPDLENTSFVDDNDVIYEIAKQPSVWKITSDDELTFQVTSAKIKRIIRNSKAFGENTWNVHVILPKSIRFFDQISKDDSTFEWKPHDRFIVLIACREKVLNKSRLDGILKTLWTKRKVQSVLVAETIAVVNDTKTDRAIRSYNPFAKVNDSGS